MTVDRNRRNFLRGMIAVGALIAVGGVAKPLLDYAVVSQNVITTFPKVKVANISQLEVNQPVIFNYPLTNEPNYLVMLDKPAEYGIGPQSNVIAFSAICEHMGCIYHFRTSLAPYGGPDVPGGHCPCHGSLYNYLEDAKVVGGPAPCPVPRVTLELDSSTGDIYAVGMEPPTIYSHGSSCGSDVTDDLQGGSVA
ncbi:MAG: Rieske 2Fe-2S domain-containing protein [Nitrososphaeria archaeon]